MIAKQFRALTKWAIEKLTKLSNRLDKKASENPYSLDDLSPIDNIENGEAYFKSLEWALSNDDIHNIAITGPYGSGKSSVIRSFKKNHTNYQYLTISLASFKDGAADKSQKPVVYSNDEHRLVEISILQQIFYKVKAKDIPDSRFKRIRQLSINQLFFYVSLIILSIFSLFVLVNPNFLNKFSDWEGLSEQKLRVIRYAAAGIILLGIIALSVYLLRFFSSKQFEKVSISSGEIAIKEDNEKSILNKHLDEIIYFFQVTRYNVVIIEDLDRFKDHEIFTKLREINTLLNQSEQVGRKVVFIYALKDDMFLDKTRTKFFDFILPVIPVVNWTNSYAILLKKINDSQLNLEIDERFVSDITFFIDDMRILKNIFNEFMIYKESLKSLALNHNKLLGIVIYKNIYPRDFSALHENKGLVYLALQKKQSAKADFLGRINSKIQEVEREIQLSEKATLTNVQELRALYIHKLVELFPAAKTLYINKIKVSIADAKSDSNFNLLRKERSIVFYYSDYDSSNSGKSFAEIEKLVDVSTSYDERAKAIDNRSELTMSGFRRNLEQLTIQKNRLQSYSLKEFIDEFPHAIDTIVSDFKDDNFLIYLLREGYIDEMYSSFISYFYEGGPTQSDMDYIMSIKNQKPLEVTLALSKFPEIIKKVTPSEFRREAAINWLLTDFLLLHKPNYPEEFESYFSQFAQKGERQMAFFLSYIGLGSHQDAFIKATSDNWNDLWETVYSNNNLTSLLKDQILKLIILNSSPSKLRDLNRGSLITEYISNKPDILLLFSDSGNLEKYKSALELLDVKVKNLEATQSFPALFDHIYQKNLYEINPAMISMMVKSKQKVMLKSELLETQNYTTIKSSGCTELIAYIDSNLDEYVGAVLLALENNTKENSDLVEELLINENLDIEFRFAIIAKEECQMTHLSVIPADLWDSIIESERMTVDWDNVVTYFSDSEEINDLLVDYLNKKNNYTELSEMAIEIDDEDDQDEKNRLCSAICKELIFSAGITDEAFSKLAQSITETYDGDLDVVSISDTRITTLIEEQILIISPANFTALKKPELKILLLVNNINKFIQDFEKYSVTANLFTLLLTADIQSENKLEIISKLSIDLIDGNSALPDIITTLIADQPNNVGYEKLIKLIAQTKDEPLKVKLLSNSLSGKSTIQLDEMFNEMGEPYSLLTELGKRPAIPLTSENFEIARILNDMGYISSYKMEGHEKIRVINNQFRRNGEDLPI